MGLFSRRKSAQDEQVAPEADFDDLDDDLRFDSGEGIEEGREEVEGGVAAVDGTTGPFDRSAVSDDTASTSTSERSGSRGSPGWNCDSR